MLSGGINLQLARGSCGEIIHVEGLGQHLHSRFEMIVADDGIPA